MLESPDGDILKKSQHSDHTLDQLVRIFWGGTLASMSSMCRWFQCSTKFENLWFRLLYSIQFSSVIQSCQTLSNTIDCSMPGLSVHHQLPEPTQTHVHHISDPIQLSHPLSSPSPPTFNLSQHQGLFQWVSSSHQLPKYWSFSFSISPSNEHSGMISFRMD